MWIKVTLKAEAHHQQEQIKEFERLGLQGVRPAEITHIWINLNQAVTIWVGEAMAVVSLPTQEDVKVYAPEEIAQIKAYVEANQT